MRATVPAPGTATTLTLLLHGATVRDACRLRRRLLEDTSAFALGRFRFLCNSSIHPSDYLAQRLALVPVRCDAAEPVAAGAPAEPGAAPAGEPLGVEGDGGADFELDVACELRDGARRTVVSGDLVFAAGAAGGGRAAVYPSQPLALLGPGQRLHVRGRGYWGRGGACYCPVVVAHFEEQQRVVFRRPVPNDSGFLDDVPAAMFEAGPRGCVARTAKPFYGSIPVKWSRDVRTAPVPGAPLRFHVETDGRLTPREALAQVGVVVAGPVAPSREELPRGAD